jgi:hypothetical protein
MALVASSLITAAKQRTFGAQGLQKLSNAMMLAELSTQDQLVVQMISQQAPELLATISGVVALTDSGNLNGYTLAGGMHYRDFTHVDVTNDAYEPINIVRRQDRDKWPKAPAAMIRTGAGAAVLHPIDPAGKRWVTTEARNWFEPDKGHSISYSYIPIPPALTGLSGTLRSPDMAREVFVTSLAVAILLAHPPTTEAEIAVWTARLQTHMAARDAAMNTLLMQVAKFVTPQGQPGSTNRQSTAEWLASQIGD